jgi:hypothetical protein
MAAIATIDWATWVTILLAAIGVLIAALGVLFTIASVVLGALAIFGFRDLKSSVIEQAGAAAKDAAKKAVDEVIAGYPSSAQMMDEIFAKLAPQVTQKFASKFDVSAAADISVRTDAPATLADVGRLAATYPEEVGLPPSDIPPEGEDEPNEK